MKKINWKIANAAFWIEIILAYVLPFRVVDNVQYKIGIPIPFITAYNTEMSASPLTSMHLNPLSFIMNAVIIYFVMRLCVRIYQKMRGN